MRNTWRMIVITTMLSLFAVGASFAALTAGGQEPPAAEAASPAASEPNAAPAAASEPTDAESGVDPNDDGEGAVPNKGPELPPDLRFNADDTFSFPVDI